MEDKKPKVLDVLRLIVAILTITGALIIGITLILAINNLFNDTEDGFSGLVFIFLIPLLIGVFVYFIVGINWVKKYNKIKNTPLIQRTITTGESIVKIVIAILFLSYACIPLVVYWAFDLIEAIMRKNLAEKLKGKPEPEFKTNETNTISDKHYCKYCGNVVDYKYARFCEHCGAEIEYRK